MRWLNGRIDRWWLVWIGMCVSLWGVGAAIAADSKSQGPAPRDRSWQVSVAPTYSSGNYGTDTTTSILYVPFSVRRLFRDGDITLTIPFVSIRSTGAVRLLGDVPNRTSNKGPGSSGSGSSGSGSGKGKKADDDPLDSSTRDSGLGDIILRGRYYVVDEGDFVPLIAVTGRIKFPTADEERGLGTGEFDEGFGFEVSKGIGLDWVAFVDGGYTFIGDPEGIDFRNQWWFDLGAGYYLTDRLFLSLYYEEYRAIVAGLSNPRDLLFAANYKATSAWRVYGSFLVGLSDGAPDYGITGGVSWRF